VCTTLKSIDGRVMDMFVLPDGSALHPYTLVKPIAHGVQWVRRYQVIQVRPDLIRVLVVTLAGHEVGAGQRATLLRLVREATPASVELEIDFVDQLPPAPSGKLKSCFSLVAS
jgi:phenylacetate-coenzyme A ligase PaaK-like adenylate-forming protein